MADLSGTQPDPPGAVLEGRYRLLSQLGRGAMGVVYRAADLQANREVAIKLLTTEFSAKRVERFRREGELAARVDRNGGVVRVYDSGSHEGAPFLVMEFVDGPSLEDVLSRRGSLPPQEAAVLVGALARTLEVVHRAGVVHRDLKPANVLVPATGPPKLTDFGIALGQDLEQLTRTGALVGTPTTMAPEQFLDSHRIDARADVYSLGATLYECLCGEPPFSASTLQEFHAYLTSPIPPLPPSSKHEGIGPELDAVCLKALEKDPARRYATARELADDLERVVLGKAISAAAAHASAWGFLRRRLDGRGRLIVATTVGLLSLLSVLFCTWLFVVRPRGEARATLARYSNWSALEDYALGVGGPEPNRVELERRVTWLAGQRGPGVPGEAAEIESRYASVLRLIRLRAGEPVPQPKSPTTLDGLVDALLRAERGEPGPALRDLRRVLARGVAPQEVTRVRPHMWGLFLLKEPGRASAKAYAQYRARLAKLGLGEEEARASAHRGAALRGWLDELLENLPTQNSGALEEQLAELREGAGTSRDAVIRTTSQSLEAAVPRLERAVRRAQARSTESVLELLEKFRHVTGVGTRWAFEPGPAFEGLLMQILQAELDAWGARNGKERVRRAERVLKLEAVMFAMRAAHEVDPRFEAVFLDVLSGLSTGTVEDRSVLVSGLRLKRSRFELYTVKNLGIMLSEEPLQRRLLLHPGCPAVRLLRAIPSISRTAGPPSVPVLQSTIAELRAVLELESPEIHADYRGEAWQVLGVFLGFLADATADTVAAAELVSQGVVALRRARVVDPRLEMAWYFARDLTGLLSRLKRKPAVLELWVQLEAQTWGQVVARRAAGQKLTVQERTGVARIYKEGAQVLWRAGFHEEALVLARKGRKEQLGYELDLCAILARGSLEAGDLEAAAAILMPHRQEGLEHNYRFSVEIVKLELARGELGKARATAELCLRRFEADASAVGYNYGVLFRELLKEIAGRE